MKSFRLFWNAVKSTRHEMWVSLQVLAATTLVLSLLLYLVEHAVQPDVFRNYWDSLLWSFMGYIGDPGEFAPYTPITFWGRMPKVCCALVNIAIFAVPAGLVASGFSDAIAEDKREKEIADYRARLGKAFRRKQDKLTKFRVVPRYVSPVDVQSMQEIDMKDIVDAVRSGNDFRMRNLASAIPQSDNPVDRLVIETIPLQGRTSYGCCINRGSRVTIVAPTAVNEVAVENFAYYLALFGEFNYISKEYEADADNPESFYLISDQESSQAMKDYLADLRSLSSGVDRWTIFLIAADSVNPEYLHFVTAVQQKLGDRQSTVIDRELFAQLYESTSRKMADNFDISAELDMRYLPVGKKNVSYLIDGGKICNAFTLRVDWKFIALDSRSIAVSYTLAVELSQILAPEKALTDSAEWKKPGNGY